MADKQQGKNFINKRIILQVVSGYGFALIKGSIVVHGTLMNKGLETKIIPGNNNVLKFASEMVWNMDNATLKELKMSNASIRINCYNIPNNKSNANIRLGYLMLKVKEAQIMNSTSNDRILQYNVLIN
ncbi:uncharacterized protein LOC112687455 [Sipha flava]|uniref:Uncharacterized protein LOC112687455 n=1 Tax=Sipha flava TaxID=143950 RepID=A0A8B8FZJ8_9HEMI|nr:uncharacterized protein LOC112687455 [Sipha flava]